MKYALVFSAFVLISSAIPMSLFILVNLGFSFMFWEWVVFTGLVYRGALFFSLLFGVVITCSMANDGTIKKCMDDLDE